MKKLKKILLACLVVFAGFMLIDCSMQKVAERHEGFTRSNVWAYYLYTDSEIRNAPRLTENYHFSYVAQNGTQPQDSSIIYSAGAKAQDLHDYLSNLGYSRVESDNLHERWEKQGQITPYFFISIDPEAGLLTLTRSALN